MSNITDEKLAEQTNKLSAAIPGTVTMPKLTHALAVAALKQYALMLDAMFKSASSSASRRTFDKERRGIMELARMVEDCAVQP